MRQARDWPANRTPHGILDTCYMRSLGFLDRHKMGTIDGWTASSMEQTHGATPSTQDLDRATARFPPPGKRMVGFETIEAILQQSLHLTRRLYCNRRSEPCQGRNLRRPSPRLKCPARFPAFRGGSWGIGCDIRSLMLPAHILLRLLGYRGTHRRIGREPRFNTELPPDLPAS
jgi:hypothetical protein